MFRKYLGGGTRGFKDGSYFEVELRLDTTRLRAFGYAVVDEVVEGGLWWR